MKFEEFSKILNYSKERNREIEERKQLKKIYEEIGIELIEINDLFLTNRAKIAISSPTASKFPKSPIHIKRGVKNAKRGN